MPLARYSWLAVSALLFWALTDSASAQANKAAPAKQAVKAAPKAAPKAQTAAKRNTSIRRAYYGKSTKAGTNRRVATKWGARTPAPRRVFYNPGQQAPTPERYTEIQRALSERGLLTKEPDGVWDQSSQDALKKFQEEHNLRADGKLSSMSIIALGLGPKRVPAGAVTPSNPRPAPSAPLPAPAVSNVQPQ